MKNFMKKLAFVMALAMVVTSIPAFTAKAATAPSLKVKSAVVYIGEKTSCWTPVQNKGEYTTAYSTTSNKITVNPKNGKITIKETATPGAAVVKVTYSLDGKITGTQSYTLKLRRSAETARLTNKSAAALTDAPLAVGTELKLQVAKSYDGSYKKGHYGLDNYKGVVTDTVALKSSNPEVLAVDGLKVKALKAGEATISIELTKAWSKVKNTSAVTKSYTVVVGGTAADITSFEATDTNVLTVKFGAAVAEDAAVTLTRGTVTSSVPVANTSAWNADRTELTLTTAAKLATGEYTVSVGDVTASCTVKEEYVAEIKILNNTALTSDDQKTAYVYYDVINQYGTSIRNTANVTWTVSANYSDNRAEGKLTITNSDDKAFTYNSMISIVGVNVKSGVSVNALVYTGLQQAIGSVEIVGFASTSNSTEIIKDLPANFKSGEYVLLYTVKDQNGMAMDAASNNIEAKNVTFLSDNVLFVSPSFTDANMVTIDGTTYCAVKILPGTYAQEGGTVTFTAIANRTGAKASYTSTTSAGQILTRFDIQQPTDIISDGQTGVEIPFVAYDQNGNVITSYDVLTEEKSSLTLTTTVGTLVLQEKNDGTAKLVFSDDDMAWSKAAEDDVDRLVNFTAVVIGGSADSELVYIKDKAYPVAITAINANEAFIENTTVTYALGSFMYVDQYGRVMGDFGADNGWFAYTTEGTPAVKITYTGSETAFTTDATATDSKNYIIKAGDSITFTAGATENAESATFKFVVVRDENDDKFNELGKTLKKTLYTVDIKKVSNVALNVWDKMAVASNNSDNAYGTLLDGAFEVTGTVEGYAASAQVTGSYNGLAVFIPTDYYSVVTGSGISIADEGWRYLVSVDTTITEGNALTAYESYYDTKAYNDQRKDGQLELTAVVYLDTEMINVKTTCTNVMTFSDATPDVSAIVAADNKTIGASNTAITFDTFFNKILTPSVTWDGVGIYDNYNHDVTSANLDKVSVTIYDVVEAAGVADGNFETNDSGVIGAEIGDTFKIKFSYTNASNVVVTKIVNVTVGADSYAKYVSQSSGKQLTLSATLEAQRAALMN